MKKRIGKKMKTFNKIKAILFILFFVLSLSLFIFAEDLGYTSENIEGFATTYYYIAPLIFIVLITLASATTLPISIAIVPGLLIFPFYIVILYATIGVVLAGIFIYHLSQYLGKDFVEQYAELKGGRLKAFNKLIHENSTKFVFLLNFGYIFPSNLGHMVAGITKLKYSKFLSITIIGNLLNNIFISLFIFGIIKQSLTYISLSIAFIILNTIIPIFVVRKNLKDILMLAFNKKINV